MFGHFSMFCCCYEWTHFSRKIGEFRTTPKTAAAASQPAKLASKEKVSRDVVVVFYGNPGKVN